MLPVRLVGRFEDEQRLDVGIIIREVSEHG